MSRNKEYNHLESYEWFGEFYFESSPDEKFSGKLLYSPSNGIQLDYIMVKQFPTYVFGDCLFGTLSKTGKVTLVNHYRDDFISGDKGFERSEDTATFKYLIFGDHFKKNELVFDGCIFELSNMNSLLDKRNGQNIKYSSAPLASAELGDYLLELKTGAITNYASSASDIFIDEPEIIDDFDKELKKVMLRHSKKYIRTIKEKYFFFSMECNRLSEITVIHDELINISNLLSMTVQSLVRPTIVYLKKNLEDKSSKRNNILFQSAMNQKMLKSFKDEKHGFLLPMTINDIGNLERTAKKWLEFSDRKINFVLEAFFSRFALSPSSYEAYVFLLAAIEQWGSEEFGTTKNLMDTFLEKYSTPEIIDRISNNSPYRADGKLTVGKVICDTRNYLVHSNKWNGGAGKYENYLNIINIGNLCEALSAALMLAFYQKMEFKEESIKKFKENIMRYCVEYCHDESEEV